MNIALDIETEARIVFGMLRHDYGEGVGFSFALDLFIPIKKKYELGNIAYNLEDEWSSCKPEDNYRFGEERLFVQWYEFEKSLPDSPYFKPFKKD